NNEKKDFLQPDKITKISVCKESGLLPTDSCPEIITVTFIKGTEPTSYCTIHQKYFETPKVKVKEYPEIKKPYYEEIEEIKKKHEEKPTETEEKEETLQSLIEKLREKHKKQDE
ncbi:unnamed protein product, partial [marine sediment metagenome]